MANQDSTGDRSKKIGNWLVALGIALSILTAGGTAAMTYGGLQNRASVMETSIQRLEADRDRRAGIDLSTAQALSAMGENLRASHDQIADFRAEWARSDAYIHQTLDIQQRKIDGIWLAAPVRQR
jgi:hypothetical protein